MQNNNSKLSRYDESPMPKRSLSDLPGHEKRKAILDDVQAELYRSRKELEGKFRQSKDLDQDLEYEEMQFENKGITYSIKKKLSDMKKQLGLLSVKTPTDKFLDKIQGLSAKVEKEFKDFGSDDLDPSSFPIIMQNLDGSPRITDFHQEKNGTEAKNKDDGVLTYMSPLDTNELKIDDLNSQYISRRDHNRIVQSELQKLEHKFINLFQQEKSVILTKNTKDSGEIENAIKKKLEHKIKDLEFKATSAEALYIENDQLKREILRLKQNESTSQDTQKLIQRHKREREALEARIIELEKDIKKKSSLHSLNYHSEPNMAAMREKIQELEISKHDLEVQLNTVLLFYEYLIYQINNEGQLDPSDTRKLFSKLEKYKSKFEALLNKTQSLEKEKDILAKRVKEFELGLETKNAAKRYKSEDKKVKKTSKVRQSFSREEKSFLDDKKLLTEGDAWNIDHNNEEIKELKKKLKQANAEINELKSLNSDLREKNKWADNVPVNKNNVKKIPDLEGSNIDNFIRFQNEIEFWKSKCELLSTKFIQIVRKLREDNESIKNDIFEDYTNFKAEIISTAKKLKKNYKRKCEEVEERVAYYQSKYAEYLSSKSPTKKYVRGRSSSKPKKY